MKTAVIAGLLMVCGCTPFSSYRPNIDMQGVDRGQYESDTRECELDSAGAGFTFGNPIAQCMVKKGYRLSHSYY